MTRLDFKALTATNRLVAQTDVNGDDPGSDLMRYDKAGNLVSDNFSPVPSQRGAMTYDAENHMVTAVNGAQRYRYDANGRRVKRQVGQTGANGEVWQVYSPEGELLAEYPKQGAATVPTKEYGYRGGQMLVVFDSTETAADDKLRWLVQDHLGSTRMIVNRSGSLAGIKRRDYLPFGEELAATVGHRAASGSGYAVDDKPRQKFGSKEHNTENGLDFFEARYFSSIQGRFTSADTITVTPARVFDPQQLNLYVYVSNNPLTFIDPTGMIIDTSLLDEKELEKWKKIAELANAKDKSGNYVNPKLHEVYEKLNSDKRTFFIENTKLGASTAGKFEITKFDGANDFSEAVIHLDFKKIESTNKMTKADLVEGFNTEK